MVASKISRHSDKLESYDGGDIFSDIRYICSSTSLIVGSLQKGFDVAQLPSGDVIVTEVKTINTQYSWDKKRKKMIKVGIVKLVE
ncbi:MAG: hypothetical protein COA94_05605 [Rickettsiales bacterium]|nr:MAG: hypothetical protein COA94_05605 [Rickettsiales bacterium]